jgi:carboxylesterase type B
VGDNIEQFGGDRNNVTIFGKSGGGRKVSVLLAMPGARSLFQRAIIQSGPGLHLQPRDRATELTYALLHELLSGEEMTARDPFFSRSYGRRSLHFIDFAMRLPARSRRSPC